MTRARQRLALDALVIGVIAEPAERRSARQRGAGEGGGGDAGEDEGAGAGAGAGAAAGIGEDEGLDGEPGSGGSAAVEGEAWGVQVTHAPFEETLEPAVGPCI